MDKHLWGQEGREDNRRRQERQSPLGTGSAKTTDSRGSRRHGIASSSAKKEAERD